MAQSHEMTNAQFVRKWDRKFRARLASTSSASSASQSAVHFLMNSLGVCWNLFCIIYDWADDRIRAASEREARERWNGSEAGKNYCNVYVSVDKRNACSAPVMKERKIHFYHGCDSFTHSAVPKLIGRTSYQSKTIRKDENIFPSRCARSGGLSNGRPAESAASGIWMKIVRAEFSSSVSQPEYPFAKGRRRQWLSAPQQIRHRRWCTRKMCKNNVSHSGLSSAEIEMTRRNGERL